MSCCDVDAIVQIDARGQLVLPKEVRARFGLEQGGKLAVVVVSKENVPCCISLMPVGALSDSVRSVLEPVFTAEQHA
jgi:AbrB family looped-hinge helix DNA binding protein